MTQENPITLDDIIKMDDIKDDLKSKNDTNPLPKQKTSIKKSVNKIADIAPKKTRPVSKASSPKTVTSAPKPKDTKEEILVEIKNISEDTKIKENEKQRIFERTCTKCNHIYFSDIPIKYFYVESKKGQNYKIIKLPIKQYPADMPKDILKMVESHECPKCRK